MSEPWIVIPNWEGFQHRDAARVVIPTWIKVYTELLSKDEFFELSFHLRGVLVSLWVEYARARRQLRGSTSGLSRRLGQRVTRRDLDSLVEAGFIELSASRPASTDASTDASLEKRREEKRPLSKEVSRAQVETAERENHHNGRREGWVENLSSYTGCRYVRGEFALTAVYDPLGQEPVPQNWPHARPTRDEVLAALREPHVA